MNDNVLHDATEFGSADALTVELATHGGWHDDRRHPFRGEKALYSSWHGANRRFPDDKPVDRLIWATIWRGTCFDCGQTPARGIDHIFPRAKGGRNVVENLQPACAPCNKRKGNRV